MSAPLSVAAGVIVTLALFALLAYVVRTLSNTKADKRLVGTLGAIAGLLIALTAVIFALQGIQVPTP
ncbi:hypothetical protein AB0J43_04115 [Nonomuraea fuscirosea]